MNDATALVFVILPTRWVVPGDGQVASDGARTCDGEVAVNPAHIAAIVPDRTYGEGCTIYLAGGKAQPCALSFRSVLDRIHQALCAASLWPDTPEPRTDVVRCKPAPLAAVGPHVVVVAGDQWTVEHPDCRAAAGSSGICVVIATFAEYWTSHHAGDGRYEALVDGDEMRLTPIGAA